MRVFDSGELFPEHTAHPLGWRVRGDQLGVLSFQFLEFPVEGIVGVVCDHRVVEDVIAVDMVVELLAQSLYPLCCLHG